MYSMWNARDLRMLADAHAVTATTRESAPRLLDKLIVHVCNANCKPTLTTFTTLRAPRKHTVVQQHRERVMLMIGVLKSLARMWPLAQRGLTQVRMYAKEVLQRPMDVPIAQIPDQNGTDADIDDHHNGDFTQIDISWMDDLLQQPIQGLQNPDLLPPDDNFLNNL